MLYSEVIATPALHLDQKNKYTQRDVDHLILRSLFTPYCGSTLTKTQARFVCRCWAIHYNTEYSKTVAVG